MKASCAAFDSQISVTIQPSAIGPAAWLMQPDGPVARARRHVDARASR